MVDELTEKLGELLDYYVVSYTIDEATWIPILTFISRDNEEKYIFRLQAEEIRDFLDGGLPPKISNMLSELMIDMRNSKIDKLI